MKFMNTFFKGDKIYLKVTVSVLSLSSLMVLKSTLRPFIPGAVYFSGRGNVATLDAV